MPVVAMLLMLAPVQAQAAPTDAATKAIVDWQAAIDPVRLEPLPEKANTAQRMARLIALDEVTRQNLWRAFDPRLTPAEQIVVETAIGTRMMEVDRANTEALKTMLPADGWFRNSRDGRQVTHGAWLIAQHSPDNIFRAAILEAMRTRLANGDIDAMDFALIQDRVQRRRGELQTYGSQAQCIGGRTAIQPMIDPAHVDERRAAIGWSKTFAETKGDLEIGKPCAM